MIKEALAQLIEKHHLSVNDAAKVMEEIMSGQANHMHIAAYLTALRMKGEAVDEITGSAQVMRKNAILIRTKHKNAVDLCGTGGDKSDTFNISTIASFVVAAAGVPVAKHGNRAVSSKCGSADLLEGLGVKIELPADKLGYCLDEVGFAFLFAPLMHTSMKHVAPVRKELGFRTIFNILGPLSNPARVKAQVVGVYNRLLAEPMVEVLKALGHERAMVVHGMDGMDEITLTTDTFVAELKDGKVDTYYITPNDGDLKFKLRSASELKGGSLSDNIKITYDVLNGVEGAQKDMVLINAAAALIVGGKAADMVQGVEVARQAIDSKAALKKLEELKIFTNKK
ncbi:MAG: anthranilate phosphoribosyltransferase [Candidatus Firestonebacteria bacterium]|nr:anthranilate phosphoribosyltransferase [Candidatus Firestonebacteria bacterium]